MKPRIFHGDLKPDDVATALISEFNRGNMRAQKLGTGDHVVVQIATDRRRTSGGEMAVSVSVRSVPDGVAIQVGRQAWLGVAASIGETAFRALRNPWSVLSRLDDLAQDIESLQVSERIWNVIEGAARAAGASYELSERLRRQICSYCRTPNSLEEERCIACGAPLVEDRPRACLSCGFIIRSGDIVCPNCGKKTTLL